MTADNLSLTNMTTTIGMPTTLLDSKDVPQFHAKTGYVQLNIRVLVKVKGANVNDLSMLNILKHGLMDNPDIRSFIDDPDLCYFDASQVKGSSVRRSPFLQYWTCVANSTVSEYYLKRFTSVYTLHLLQEEVGSINCELLKQILEHTAL